VITGALSLSCALTFSSLLFCLPLSPFSTLPFHRCIPFSLRRHSLKGEFPFCYYLNKPERGKSINSPVRHLPAPESCSINRRLTLPLFTRIMLTRRMNGKLKMTTGSWREIYHNISGHNLKVLKNFMAQKMILRILLLQ